MVAVNPCANLRDASHRDAGVMYHADLDLSPGALAMSVDRRQRVLVSCITIGIAASMSACSSDETWDAVDPCSVIDMDQLRALSYKPDEITTTREDQANGARCNYQDRTRLAAVQINELPEVERNAPRIDPPIRDVQIGGHTVYVANETHNKCSVYFTADTLSVTVDFHPTNYTLEFGDQGCEEMRDVLTSTVNNITGNL